MDHYLIKKIGDVDENDFQTFVAELWACFDLSDEGIEHLTLANLFSDFVTEQKKPDLNRLPTDKTLSRKVKELILGSAVYGVCLELARHKGKAMDDFAGKSVFALIKQCYKSAVPALSRAKKPTRLQREHQFKTKLAKRRRSNDSPF